MTFLTIPCHWNKQTLNKINKMNIASSDIRVAEIYGTLAKSPIGHGRSPKSVPNVKKEHAINFKKYINHIGLKFSYLTNAPFSFKGKPEKNVTNYLSWIIKKLEPEAMTIASHDLIKYIRNNYPLVKINVSTIAGIKNVKQLKTFEDIKPKRIIPHHDVNRNFKDLREIIKETTKRGIELELMATESCLRNCPNRIAHYKHLGGSNADKPFHTSCNLQKLIYPREILKSNFIRPEDLSFYEKMGVKIFKITGRSKRAQWLPEVVEAYLKRSYKGNLIRLLGIDPSLNAEDWIYINNIALNGFLKGFPKSGKKSDENYYCDKWICKLYKNGDFYVKDGSKYEIKNETLYCYKQGKMISSLSL